VNELRFTFLQESCTSAVCWMQEGSLPFAEKRKSQFIHGRRSDRPGMAEIQLLDALVGQVAKTGQAGAAGLELGKRLGKIMIGKVVVAGQALVFCQLMIDLDRELIAGLMPEGNSLESAVGPIRAWNILVQEIERGLIHASLWNYVGWKISLSMELSRSVSWTASEYSIRSGYFSVCAKKSVVTAPENGVAEKSPCPLRI